ncbi:unnamed protein product [Orchesella dallaii]|uniref:Uncharacterized protein n=1 Tax=Orchesella dallaii TaxID=48710 RepID=A0ABP1RF82_9HEXA
MSYSDRLAASSTMKPKQSNINGESKASSSSSSAGAAATTTTTNPTAHGSKSLINRVPPDRKRTSSTNPPKKYSSPPLTPSDDFTSAVILRKRNPSKNTVVLGSSRNISVLPNKTLLNETSIIGEKTNEKNKCCSNILKLTKVVTPPGAKGNVVHEGPVELLPEENFDFYRILARPKVWEEEEDYVNIKSSEHGEDRFSRKVRPSPSYTMKRKESEIWGSMRTSTAEESSIPSLTSIPDEDTKGFVVGSVECSGGEIIRDENNNVLATIKNTIFGSLSLFDASRNDDDDNGKRNDAVDEETISQLSYSSPTSEEGQVKEQGCEEKINVQASHNNNIYFNSVPRSLSPTHGQMQSLETSVLIPQKIEEQLHREFHVDTSRCLENHSICLSTSQKSEKNTLPSSSPFIEINPAMAKMEDPDSVQLASDASLSEGEKREQFHDVGCDASSSHSSIISNNSYYVDTVPPADHQTQTQSVDYQDMETGTESEHELKKKKMMRFAMAVNSGIDIAPAEPKKKSVRIKGIMKMSRPGTPCSVPSTSSISSAIEDAIRTRAIQERNRPQTCAQLGADYGFPSDISISGFIGNLVPSKWASSTEENSRNEDNENEDAVKENVSHTTITYDEGDKSRSFMGAAYDILSAGLKYASSLIGDEAELEPREDTIHYNGYKIKVFGRKLLLESLHVNCNFYSDSSNGGGSGGQSHSSNSFKPHGLRRERDSLEQSCDGRRIRIVIRFTGPNESKVEEANTIVDVEHTLRFGEGTWTFVCECSETGENFVDILCPTGVHPECLVYGIMNDLLFIDAP